MYSVRYDVVCSAGTVVNIHREIFLSKMIGTQLYDELCVRVCVQKFGSGRLLHTIYAQFYFEECIHLCAINYGLSALN